MDVNDDSSDREVLCRPSFSLQEPGEDSLAETVLTFDGGHVAAASSVQKLKKKIFRDSDGKILQPSFVPGNETSTNMCLKMLSSLHVAA